jgi:hypothetical protein
MATHVHTGRWLEVRPRHEVQRLPRRAKQRTAWTSLFFSGEPRPWHTGAAIFGIVTIGLYLVGMVVLPLIALS